MKRIIALLLAASVLLSFAACGKSIDKQAFLNGKLDGTKFSGVVLMTQNGHTVCEAAMGVENDRSKEPITMDSLFCIGSVSKQFTACAILLLQQDGKLSIDDRLTQYFPQYAAGSELTIRHLLEMRSGIAEFYDVEYIDDAFTELPTGELRNVITNDNTAEQNRRILESWLLRQPLQFEPDTTFEYSNSNYFLLARIVELVSKQSYEDFIRSRIFEPLGMSHSLFIDEVDLKTLQHLAAPTVKPQTVYVGVTMGLGDMISNAHDIDKWLTSLKAHSLLTQESIALMSTNYSESDDEDYGFGIRTSSLGLYHYGYITTYQTLAFTNPESGVNVITVTNDDPNPNITIDDIGWSLIEQCNVS